MDTLMFLQSLVDLYLCYGIKSPDMDLYDFGFVNEINSIHRSDKKKVVYTHCLHVVCRFKVIWKIGNNKTDIYHENTSCEKFHSKIAYLIGMKVKRVALSEKNDLWLDFGDCWVVFVTVENNEESWRLISPDTDAAHLVASNSWVYFEK